MQYLLKINLNDRKRQENRKFTSGVLPALYEATKTLMEMFEQ